MFRIADFGATSLQSTVLLAGAWALILAGILTLPVPAPTSTPAITLGGLLLARRSRRFRTGVAALRRRWPDSSRGLTRRSAGWPRPLRYVVLRTDPRRVRAAQKVA